MAKSNHEEPIDPELRALYPGKSDEWLREAQGNLNKYMELMVEIYERIREDPSVLHCLSCLS